MVFFLNLNFFSQENEPIETSSIKEKVEFNLEINKKSYDLYLAGTTLETGYFIKFKNKQELENFLLKAIEIISIPSEKRQKKETIIEWTYKDEVFTFGVTNLLSL